MKSDEGYAMTDSTLNILITDDDAGDRAQVRRLLNQSQLACECVETTSMTDAFAACNERKFDCAILDYRLPGCDGLEGISSLHDKEPYMPIVMLTGKGDEHIATEAMKRGASDYLPKARVDPVLIKRVIESAVEKSALRRKVDQQRRELEKFASGLVYDLKSPIAAMQTFARFIEEDVRAPTTDKNRIAMHCQAVALAGRRINTLIDALYAYTKADAHSTFEPVDVTAALEDAVAALRVLIKERGAKVTHGELPFAIGNGPQLAQLLEHLIDNAIKNCDGPTPKVHVSAAHNHGNAWLFRVKDNGVGIAEEFRQHVFEPFRRLPYAGCYDGSGLGLATCRKIVERHEGRIWCESEDGKGTTFFFTLPTCFKPPLSR
jgi:signal transduction histidine kinase